MKTDLSKIDAENFIVKQDMIAGETCTLIFPRHIGCKWTRDTLIFRSSVWNSQGELISAGFKKFFNWGELPDLVTHPESMDDAEAITKIDGSLLSVARYRGELIIRTRGTFSAYGLDNGYEIDILRNKYPKAFEFDSETSDCSRIFEWTTPNNRIVIDYGVEPELWYIGRIRHNDYSYASQMELDSEASVLGTLRPKRYRFGTLIELIEAVKAFDGVEGVCIYYNGGQDIRKVKSLKYLAQHAFKSSASLDSTLDLFVEYKCPCYQEFMERLKENFDYECIQMVAPYVSTICDAYKEVVKIIYGMMSFVEKIRCTLPTRKEQVCAIIQAYGKTNRASYCFILLDYKELEKDALKKLIYQVIKK